MQTLLTLLVIVVFNVPTQLIVNGENPKNIDQIESIDYPRTIEISNESHARIEVLLVLGGRRIWKKETYTNKKITLPQFDKVSAMVIKIKLPKREAIYRIDLNKK